ncbi:MAG: PQQ-binding-like beta-propeller repeat protein, partial [Candidatus Solibacter usitatus]|nr:PQQ-binding-like beta-propeller repeat protein [Candidatus Solibacter usitatus]
NLFANSVVVLRGSTGKMVWHFQTVHHDLWDYDVPAQPVLIQLRALPAVVQATKTGMLFVLNRETGTPVFPVEERAVPGSDIPGEKPSPTQPFSTLPPLVPHTLTPADAWGVTPFDRRGCRDQIGGARHEGIFTPPSFQGTVQYPGLIGGTNWGSVAYDPARSLVLVNTSKLPFLVGLVPRDQVAQARKQHGDAEWAPMKGTPYAMWRRPLLSKLKLPCVPPPWGTLAAVDLIAGKIKWQVPLGTLRDLAPVPLPIKTGVPSMGGPIATAGGLTFIAAALDNYIRAFDTDTGVEVWKARLPAGGQATPLTYQAGGKQYLVICAGGHGRLPVTLGDHVIAFALP